MPPPPGARRGRCRRRPSARWSARSVDRRRKLVDAGCWCRAPRHRTASARRDIAAALSASDFVAFSAAFNRPSTTGSVTGARGAACALSSRARRAAISSIAFGSTLAGAGRAARSLNCFSIAASRGPEIGRGLATGGKCAAEPQQQDREQAAGRAGERVGPRQRLRQEGERPAAIGRRLQFRARRLPRRCSWGGSWGGCCGGGAAASGLTAFGRNFGRGQVDHRRRPAPARARRTRRTLFVGHAAILDDSIRALA